MRETTDLVDAAVQKLAPWLARHEVAPGVFTPVAPGTAQARQADYDSARATWLFDVLEKADGRGARGRTVLDVGCASGLFLFEALRRGARHAVGIEGRELHVEQGCFVARATGVSNVDFRCLDLRQFVSTETGSYDIVLCLDMLSICSDPLNTLIRLTEIASHALILATPLYRPAVPLRLSRVLPERQALMLLRTEDASVHNKKGLEPLVLTPTYEAALEMLWNTSAAAVYQLIPPRHWAHPTLPLGDFGRGKRAMFVAFGDGRVTLAPTDGVRVMPGVEADRRVVFPDDPSAWPAVRRWTKRLWERIRRPGWVVRLLLRTVRRLLDSPRG